MPIKKRTILFLFIIMLFILNCEKEILVKRIPTDLPELTQLPKVENLLYSSANVSWSVNEPCTTRIDYWIPGNNDTLSISENEYRQNHTVQLLGLSSNTQYNFQVKCFNRYDYAITSNVYPFRTIFNYTNFVNKGWNSFESVNFDSAQYYFSHYLEYVPNNLEALNGLAWTFCKLNLPKSSLTYFDKALQINSSNDDVISGKALASYKMKSFPDAIKNAKTIHNIALTYWGDNWETYNPLDSAIYVFQHDSTFDNLDIALILADSYYNTLDYQSSQTVVKFLYPNSPVHPLIPDSWFINDITYNNYEGALGALIDSLKGEYWENGEFPE